MSKVLGAGASRPTSKGDTVMSEQDPLPELGENLRKGQVQKQGARAISGQVPQFQAQSCVTAKHKSFSSHIGVSEEGHIIVLHNEETKVSNGLGWREERQESRSIEEWEEYAVWLLQCCSQTRDALGQPREDQQ